MDIERINELNANVHQSNDLDNALNIYNLLKENGYEIKSNMGTLMDYCKNKGIDKVKQNVELLVKYDEELGKKENATKAFYNAIYSADKSGSLDKIEALVNADTSYNIETDARYHDASKPDNGKSIFTMRIEEIKRKMGGDDTSSKLEHAKKSLEENYNAFRNLTAEDLKSSKAMKLREAIDQNRYYINQLEGMSSNNTYRVDSLPTLGVLSAEVKELQNFINSLKLSDDTRKALIDEFTVLKTKINDQRNYIVNLQGTSKKCEALLSEMNIEKSSKNNKKVENKTTAKEPDIKEGDIVTYNGKGAGILAQVGQPDSLVVGKEYKVEKIVVFKGIKFAKLEGVDKLANIICFDKVMKKDIEKASEEKKAEGTMPTSSAPQSETPETPVEENDVDKKHDFKVKKTRKRNGEILPMVWRTLAIAGICLNTLQPAALIIAAGWLVAEAINAGVKGYYKLPKLGNFAKKFKNKYESVEMSEEESKDAAAVVNEIDKAVKPLEEEEAKKTSPDSELDAEAMKNDIEKAMEEIKQEKAASAKSL